MRSPASKQQQQQLTCNNLPLAVYREVAAHLRQVSGVNANLILRPTKHDATQKFDYYQSQVAALEIDYATDIQPREREQVERILNYYAQRYHPWQEYSAKQLIADL